MKISNPLEETWDLFRLRMPREAMVLIEGMESAAGQATAVSEAPSNMLLEIEGDGGRARAQIAARRRQTGVMPPQMLPSFETALSGRNDSMMTPGRVASVGDHAAWAPQAMAEEAEPQMLTEG